MKDREFSRYRELLTRLALPSLRQGVEAAAGAGSQGASVLAGAAPAALLLRDDPSLHEALARGLQSLAAAAGPDAPWAGLDGATGDPVLRDPAGHSRKIYYPLIVHLHLAAALERQDSLAPERLAACRAAAPEATAPARRLHAYAQAPAPVPLTALTLWQALCLLDAAALLRDESPLGAIDAAVDHLVARPGPEGSLHPRDAEESLDAWTYRELSGLHALANLALARQNPAWSRRVEAIAMHHLENTQPDHTTSQPWGVFAFLWSPRTRVVAEQQIHDATAQGTLEGPGLGPLPAMLLADAAACLARFG